METQNDDTEEYQKMEGDDVESEGESEEGSEEDAEYEKLKAEYWGYISSVSYGEWISLALNSKCLKEEFCVGMLKIDSKGQYELSSLSPEGIKKFRKDFIAKWLVEMKEEYEFLSYIIKVDSLDIEQKYEEGAPVGQLINIPPSEFPPQYYKLFVWCIKNITRERISDIKDKMVGCRYVYKGDIDFGKPSYRKINSGDKIVYYVKRFKTLDNSTELPEGKVTTLKILLQHILQISRKNIEERVLEIINRGFHPIIIEIQDFNETIILFV